MKKTLALVLALLMVFALFAGCSKKEEADSGNTGNTGSNAGTSSGNTITAVGTGKEDTQVGTSGVDLKTVDVHPSDTAKLKMTFDAEPLGMTPPGQPFAKAYNQGRIFCDTLVWWNSDTNDIEPKLAKSWEWINDTTLRMYLEENVTSIGGDPFTASDVVFTIQTGYDLAANASYFGMFDMEKTKAVDTYTVDLALQNPYPYLVLDLTNGGAYAMLVEKTYKDIGGADASKDDPSALTGPYKLDHWEQGVCVYAERRDDYWGKMPYYKYIEEYTVTDPNTRSMGVEAGDYDLDPQSTSTSVLNADGKKVKGWSLNSVGAYTSFMLNSDTEPLNVKECRQAISLALDREALLKVCLDGLGLVTDSIYGQLHPAYQPWSGKGENNYRYDVEAAKQKLIDAGYADGFTIDCKYRASGEVTKAAEAVHGMLSVIGIDLQLITQESATWYADMRSGNWNTHIASGGNPNPKRLMTSVNPTSTHNAATGCSGANWDETGTVPELITKCLTTVDETQRNAYLAEFQDICREYVPMITLFNKATYCYANAKIAYIGLDVMGTIDFPTPYEADYLG
jgi:peptide/nickel transport system substrate-binding protein